MILLIKLILAHLLGDFLLQPDSWVKAKEEKKISAWQLYLHILIHFVLIMVLVNDFSFLKWALILSLLHLGIDIAKLYLQAKKTKRRFFFVDQIMHFIFILLLWIVYSKKSFLPGGQTSEYYLELLTFIYAITQPSSVLIRKFISRWSPDAEEKNSDSLEKAGNYIGIL